MRSKAKFPVSKHTGNLYRLPLRWAAKQMLFPGCENKHTTEGGCDSFHSGTRLLSFVLWWLTSGITELIESRAPCFANCWFPANLVLSLGCAIFSYMLCFVQRASIIVDISVSCWRMLELLETPALDHPDCLPPAPHLPHLHHPSSCPDS